MGAVSGALFEGPDLKDLADRSTSKKKALKRLFDRGSAGLEMLSATTKATARADSKGGPKRYPTVTLSSPASSVFGTEV
jgi:hypothetical protein